MPEIRVRMEEFAMLKGKIMSAVVLMDIMGHVVTTEVRFNYLVLITIIRAIVLLAVQAAYPIYMCHSYIISRMLPNC